MKMHTVMGYINGCPYDRLNDTDWLEEQLARVTKEAGFTLIKTFTQAFNPHGVTGVAVIGESHIAIHTWPEHGLLFAEVVSCSTQEQAIEAFDLMADLFPNVKVTRHVFDVSPDTSQVITE